MLRLLRDGWRCGLVEELCWATEREGEVDLEWEEEAEEEEEEEEEELLVML